MGKIQVRLPLDFGARKFQLWTYAVSHAQMLLRSNQSESSRTRIDLLFKNVHAVNLATVLDGLCMTEMEAEAAREARACHSIAELPGTLYIAMRSRTSQGYVIAGTVFAFEDTGSYSDPSALWPRDWIGLGGHP